MSCSGNSKSYQFQSTHPLRGATDDLLKKLAKAIFQSTHPLRGATAALSVKPVRKVFQSTHPLRGATVQEFQFGIFHKISIHAPLAGCDVRLVNDYRRVLEISIHAPLAGCDPSPNPPAAARHYFNPRTPCGVRHPVPRRPAGALGFQSTHPLRGATMIIPRQLQRR